jgi:replicative DNA helicase
MSEQLNAQMPPYSQEAEQSVLGCMLLRHESVVSAIDQLRAEAFYTQAHQSIFEAMVRLFERSTPVDMVTVTDELRQMDALSLAGGGQYIADLSNYVPSTSNAEEYIRIVEEKYLLRRLVQAAADIQAAGYRASEDIDLILDYAEKQIFAISQQKSRVEYEAVREILIRTIDRIDELSHIEGGIIGLPTGFTDFDNMTSGLNPSDFALIAARPSMGKTALALNIVHHMAVKKKIPVAIFSLEMSREQLVQRILSKEAEIPLQKLRTGNNLSEEEWQKINNAMKPLGAAPIYVDDTPGINALEIRSKARRMKAEHNIQMIVIDYLQLMSGRDRAESRQQEISEISRSLKGLARELNIPVLALSQLSRAPENRTDHRPLLSDLRESGAIEQDADLVAFLYRDAYYNPNTEVLNKSELIIAKQRNGPTGTVNLTWRGECATFGDFSVNKA